MQFVELTPHIKTGVIKHLEAYPRLLQFLPASKIFAMQVPEGTEYPYIRFRDPISTPYEASCWTGTTCRFTLDAYAQSNGISDGESAVGQIAAMTVEAMNTLAISGLGIIQNEYLGARIVSVDSDADRWRAMIEYTVTAVMAA